MRHHDDRRKSTCQVDANLTHIRNVSNLGIATALNQGLHQLRRLGMRYALLLDQDSDFRREDLVKMHSAAERTPDAAGVVPIVKHPLPGMRCRWPQALRISTSPAGAVRSGWRFRFIYADQMETLTRVDVAISSGMLLKLELAEALGDFDDELFIDLVDTDFCLRALQRGRHFYAVPATRMEHSIGTPSKYRAWGATLYPTHHAVSRHYTMARNRIRLLKRHARAFPFWAIYELLGGVKLFIKMLLAERERVEKIMATLRGTRDGFRK